MLFIYTTIKISSFLAMILLIYLYKLVDLLKSLKNDLVLEIAIPDPKNSFLLIIFSNLYPMISVGYIYLDKTFCLFSLI